jgi:hypothetical protein
MTVKPNSKCTYFRGAAAATIQSIQTTALIQTANSASVIPTSEVHVIDQLLLVPLLTAET